VESEKAHVGTQWGKVGIFPATYGSHRTHLRPYGRPSRPLPRMCRDPSDAGLAT